MVTTNTRAVAVFRFSGIIVMHRVVGCCARAKGKVFRASCSHAEAFSLLYVTAFRVVAPTSVATSTDESSVKGILVCDTHLSVCESKSYLCGYCLEVLPILNWTIFSSVF